MTAVRWGRGRFGRTVAAVTAAVCALSAAACGSSDDEPVTTVTVTSTPGASSAPSEPSTRHTDSGAKLAAGFTKLQASLSSPVGVAIVPVGGGDPVVFGDQTPRVAWSTIKVPLAVAAERKNGRSDAEAAAIVNSDNAAAESLWGSLGTPKQAAAAVTEVLREGGDEKSTVPSERAREGFSIFGQTRWSVRDAATFTAALPCMDGTDHVLELMGGVAGNQQWGLEAIEKRATAVKGGWGPAENGGYLVRQIGIVTLRNGARVAVAMATQTAAGSDAEGAAVLSSVGEWIGENLTAVPSGRCR